MVELCGPIRTIDRSSPFLRRICVPCSPPPCAGSCRSQLSSLSSPSSAPARPCRSAAGPSAAAALSTWVLRIQIAFAFRRGCGQNLKRDAAPAPAPAVVKIYRRERVRRTDTDGGCFEPDLLFFDAGCAVASFCFCSASCCRRRFFVGLFLLFLSSLLASFPTPFAATFLSALSCARAALRENKSQGIGLCLMRRHRPFRSRMRFSSRAFSTANSTMRRWSSPKRSARLLVPFSAASAAS